MHLEGMGGTVLKRYLAGNPGANRANGVDGRDGEHSNADGGCG